MRPGHAAFVALSLLVPASTVAADFAVSNVGASAYSINGAQNPTLTLTRGATYTFSVNALGHPFFIRTQRVTGTGSTFDTGVTNNGAQSGTLTFVVPQAAPNALFYNCQFHSSMGGTINIQGSTAAESSTWSAIKRMFE
jgi:hypothetical protein